MDDRLENLVRTIDGGVKEHSQILKEEKDKLYETVRNLYERMQKIDSTVEKTTNLSEAVVKFQDILSNTQSRGHFGEIQLYDLLKNMLAPNQWKEKPPAFSNGKQADCLLLLPKPPGPIVVDSKFPLESYLAFRKSENDEQKKNSLRDLGIAVKKHVQDISGKYILPSTGETADCALMFLPAEAVYAEIHASLPDVVQESHRRKVFIVSPSTLMATLMTVRAIFKDIQMKEQAGVIQTEVLKMVDDVNRLSTRAGNLKKHFEQAKEDLNQIEISAGKILNRGEKICEADLGENADQNGTDKVDRLLDEDIS